MRIRIFSALTLCALLLSSRIALAQSSHYPLPRTLSYQGVLSVSGNHPVGSRLLTVTLYGDANGTIKLWQGTMNTNVDSSGVFNCLLGSGDNPLPDPQTMDRPVWLGVAVDGGPELRPLSQVTASAYALNVVDNAITAAKLADNAVTTTKIADSSITASKLNFDYLSSLNINGVQFTGHGTPLNIRGDNGVMAYFEYGSNTLVLSGTGTNGQNAPVVSGDPSGTNTDDGSTYGVPGNPRSSNFVGGGDHNEAWPKRIGTAPDTNGWDVVTGGLRNKSWGNIDAVVGGDTNLIWSDSSFIGGGAWNIIDTSQNYAVIGGGQNNRITNFLPGLPGNPNNPTNESGDWHFLGGGYRNTIFTDINASTENRTWGASTLVGGQDDTLISPWGFIGGGQNNMVAEEPIPHDNDAGDHMAHSTLVGGFYNSIDSSSRMSFIGGGGHNHIAGVWNGQSFSLAVDTTSGDTSNDFSTIAGGDSNRIVGNSQMSTIGGGNQNHISNGSDNEYSTIAGGQANTVQSKWGAISGGEQNSIYSRIGTISGGDSNIVHTSSDTSAIGGGAFNAVTGAAAVVSGGTNNSSGSYSAVAGGQHLTLGSNSFGFNANYAADVSSFSNTGYFGNVNVWLGSTDNTAHSLRFYSPNINTTYTGAHYSSFQAPAQNGNITYTLPDTVIAAKMFLEAESVTAVSGGLNVQLEWDTVTGSGGGVTGNFWSLNGNAGTNPGSPKFNFLGTQDSAAFEIHVLDTGTATGGDKRVMRYSEGPTSPNILGGSSANSLGTGLSGASILSGGSLVRPNVIDSAGNYSVIAGGDGNLIQGPYSGIASGDSNQITAAGADHNFIGGGYGNVEANPSFGVIGGGVYNYLAYNAYSSTIGGGENDTVFGSRCFLGAGGENNIAGGSYNDFSVLVGGQWNKVESPYTFLGGGYENYAHGIYTTLGGGDLDTANLAYGFLGGGFRNHIDYGSDTSVLVGGANNYLMGHYSALVGGYENYLDSEFAFLGGGAEDTNLSPQSVIDGGVVNKINHGSGRSVLVGGGFNLIDTSAPLSFIGGGCNHRIYGDSNATIAGGCGNIVNGYAGFIGGGVENQIHAGWATISGGGSNRLDGILSTIAGGGQNDVKADGGSIGGGFADTIALGGFNASIPGGDHLTAQSYAQTVIGFYNVPSGSAIDSSSRFKNRDNYLLIAGNGGNVGGKTVRSDAFDVTIGGHSIVHDMDSSNASITNNSYNQRFPIYGGRYLDNTNVAEGDVIPTDTPTMLDIPIKANADFGVFRIFHPHVGEFIILILNTDASNKAVTLVNGFVTATLKDNDGSIGDSIISAPGCGSISATNLYSPYVMPSPYNTYLTPTEYSAWFIIRTSEASGCSAWDRPFYFKVCARPF